MACSITATLCLVVSSLLISFRNSLVCHLSVWQTGGPLCQRPKSISQILSLRSCRHTIICCVQPLRSCRNSRAARFRVCPDSIVSISFLFHISARWRTYSIIVIITEADPVGIIRSHRGGSAKKKNIATDTAKYTKICEYIKFESARNT